MKVAWRPEGSLARRIRKMTERSYDKGYDDTRYDQARRESGRFGRYLSTRSPETWMFFVAGVFLGGFFF